MLFNYYRCQKTKKKKKKRTLEKGEEKEVVLGLKNILEMAGAWIFSHFSVSGIVRIAQCDSHIIFQIAAIAGVVGCQSLELPR